MGLGNDLIKKESGERKKEGEREREGGGERVRAYLFGLACAGPGEDSGSITTVLEVLDNDVVQLAGDEDD